MITILEPAVDAKHKVLEGGKRFKVNFDDEDASQVGGKPTWKPFAKGTRTISVMPRETEAIYKNIKCFGVELRFLNTGCRRCNVSAAAGGSDHLPALTCSAVRSTGISADGSTTYERCATFICVECTCIG